ncbi:MAG: tetratricopeptide repeat protein [Acidimicrobiia bacterium]|nr:tetratricopeptide repeat protein [Acidimicrobiia bacterium]
MTWRQLDDQVEQVRTDLVDVEAAVACGDLDADTGDRLRATYRGELAELERRLGELDGAGEPEPPPRDRRRMVAGTLLVLAGLATVGALLAGSVADRRPGDPAVGGVPGDVVSGAVDLDAVSNEEMEAVVARNPDVTGMRLALADRYFAAGEFDRAVDHYLIVLEQEPGNVTALGAVGWMTHLSGRSDIGLSYVERALAIDPDFAQGYWYLANIRAEGLGDPAGAVEPLRALLGFDGLPEEIRTAAEAMLDRVTP